MAVTGFAKEVPRIRDGVRDEMSGRRQYFRRYLVRTDSKLDGPAVILNAPGLPSRGMPYSTLSENDPAARVVRRRASESPDSWMIWHVDVEYDTVRPPDKNPLDDPPDIRVGSEPYRKPFPGKFSQDASSNPDGTPAGRMYKALTNSAGEPFDPPLDYQASRPLITITRNEGAFDLRIPERFTDSVNAEDWGGIKKHHAYMRSIEGRRVYAPGENNDERDVLYWEVTYQIAINREGWDLELLDVGHFYWPLKDDGERKATPVPFTAGGVNVMGYLDGNKGGKLPANEEPKYLTIKEGIKEDTWSLLSLPTDINTEAYAREATRRSKRGA